MPIITAIIALGAAITASMITIFGVWLNNKHNRRLQDKALEHQARENNLNRKMELRKNVYLEVAEQLTVAMQHLGTLHLINFAEENPSLKLNPFFIAANKALLVSTDESVDKLNELISAVTKVFLILSHEALPSQDLIIERNIQQTNYDSYNSERSRILASMTQFNEEARVESQVWDALNRNLKFTSEQAEKANLLRRKADASLQFINKKLAKMTFKQMKPLALFSLSAMVALRAEMEISSDLDHYRISLDKRFCEIEKLVMEFLGELED